MTGEVGHYALSSLQSYLKEINQHISLNVRAGKRVDRKAPKGDKKACEQLIRANLNLVVSSIAKKYTK